jgi:hypothetical protein
MPILMSCPAASAAAAAIAFSAVGLTSVRAADYLPPPDSGPPPAYAPPPIYDWVSVEVVPVYPPPIYVVPPVAYPYGYPRYTYAPIYHGPLFAPLADSRSITDKG